MESRPDRKVSPGMVVMVESSERLVTLSGLGGSGVTTREGVVGDRVRWEQRWVEFELVVEGAAPQSITLLVPISWCRLGLLDRYRHFRERSSLPDLITGPFPVFERGEPRIGFRWGRERVS